MQPTNLQRRANTLLGLLLLGCGVLYSFAPQDYHFYPVCPFYALTHLLCPGCGGTRALYYLLHGNLAEAWHFNALVTLGVPILLAWFAYWYCSVMLRHRAPRFQLHWSAIAFLLVLAGAFVIVRNTGIAFTI
jgi:Protein of unknown function (DUF2752)